MADLDKALQMYYDKFGENYPLGVADDRDDSEILADIRECIFNNKPAEEPEYEKGLVY